MLSYWACVLGAPFKALVALVLQQAASSDAIVRYPNTDPHLASKTPLMLFPV